MKSKLKIAGLIAGPLLFIVIMLLGRTTDHYDIYKVLAIATWMIIWWMTESAPIAVTALLPMVLIPYTRVATIGEASAPYASPIIFLFMGGFIIALGLEKYNLHERVALNIIKLTGTSGDRIILGFMLATAALSMWISNTATAVMMLPIASSVVKLLTKSDGSAKLNTSQKRFALGLMLCIAYSANIGGTMTLIGTPPNVVMAGNMDKLLNIQMSFAQWLALGIPIGLLLLFATYLLITKLLFVNNLDSVEGSDALIEERLNALGKISSQERSVIFVFAITATLWILNGQINSMVGYKLLSNTTTAMSGGILMFLVPSNWKKYEFLLNWDDTKKLPWGILILFGGGMCLAVGMEKVGIIKLVGDFVAAQSDLNIIILIAIVTTIVLLLTEVMSNVALITIFLPVIIGISQSLDIQPLLLVIPATIASSCAFMMPISTPPNAIVFASGHIKIKEMVKAGILLNIIAITILVTAGYWIIQWVYY